MLASTYLCQPRILPTSKACDAEAALLATWCTLVKWHSRTSVCELQEELPQPRATVVEMGGAGVPSSTRDELHRCIRMERVHEHSTSDLSMRPSSSSKTGRRVAIVESMTSNHFASPGVPLAEEHRRTVHSVGCWARRHNYTLVLHPVPLAELRTGYSKAYGPRRHWGGVSFDKINDVRHRVVERYLRGGKYDHVLHVDTDTIALNVTRSLHSFTRHPAAMQLQVRENGEVAGATYLARRSPEARCFLKLWDRLGHMTHRNPRPMLNTDNGVLLMLIARLLDTRSALKCEADAVAAAGEGPSSHGQPMPPPSSRGRWHGFSAYASTYLPCFAERLTPSLLRHRMHSHSFTPKMEVITPTDGAQPQESPKPLRLSWLRFLFPREGWQRSFENPHLAEGQHASLVNYQPSTDLLGHGWKAMGRTLVPLLGGACAPLSTEPLLKPEDLSSKTTSYHPSRARGATRQIARGEALVADGKAIAMPQTLSAEQEAALAIQMCWWLHPVHGAAACRACSYADGATGRVLLRYKRVGGPRDADGRHTLLEHRFNLTARDMRGIFGVSGCWKRAKNSLNRTYKTGSDDATYNSYHAS